MSIGIILTHFDERKGFRPVLYSPLDLDANLIKDITFRSTLNLVGGSQDLSEERESFIDLPEYELIGCSYLQSVESSAIRGGNMPIITILFLPTSYRSYIYHNLVQIMENLKKLMTDIIPNWKHIKFQNINKLESLLSKYLSDFRISISGFLEKTLDRESKNFVVACPKCFQEMNVLVPNEIPDLLVMPITNAPCGHLFDAYFTKGPNFRGTSDLKSSESKDDLKDIFNNI